MSYPGIAAHKRTLRKELRLLRRGLSASAQASAGRALCERVLHSHHYQRARHIACYFPAAGEGEIDTRPLIRASLAAGKHVYLPVIEGKRMHFHRYQRGTRLHKSRFGLLQPRSGKPPFSSAALDLVIVPLVGFDRSGARLGMGGGFYDRSFRRAHRRAASPLLLGVAHSIQELARVPLERWDKNLHAIATETHYFARFGKRAAVLSA